MLVELKNGETLNGHLVMCDTWMNLTLKEVVQTSPVRDPSTRTKIPDADTLACRKATSSSGYPKSTSRETTCVHNDPREKTFTS